MRFQALQHVLTHVGLHKLLCDILRLLHSVQVDMEATGVNVGIIMSCKQQSNSGGRDEPRYQNLPKEHVQILRQNIGTVIQVWLTHMSVVLPCSWPNNSGIPT